MKTIIAILALGLLAGVGYVAVQRVSPIDAQRWHVDPVAAPDPGLAGVRLVPPAAPEFSDSPQSLAARIDALMRAAPRTRPIAGSAEALHVTYLTRTKWLGFRDLTTVRVVPLETGATLAIVARSQIGGYDYGVNRARVADLLRRLDAPAS